MKSFVDAEFKFKICVDSAPLAERALAVRAGLGFIGRNHMLINPELGCQIFLGEIVTTLGLRTDEPTAGDCADCSQCIDACPTGALRSDGQFDASRCINYLTIEHKGPIAPEMAEKIGDRVFGCNECVLVCPYQKDAPACTNKKFKFHGDRAKLELVCLVSGRVQLDTRSGPREYLTVLGPRELWRLVTLRRDRTQRREWVYREDIL